MKKLLILLCLLLCLSSCTKTEKRKEEVEDDKTYVNDVYEEIEGNCVIYYASQDEVLSMLKHGTGVVFFSWIDCPWCHRYINDLNSICAENNLEVLYYDIYDDRDSNSDFYQEVKDFLNAELEEENAFDSSGKTRIYVPNVYFVSQGKVLGHDNTGSMESDFENHADEYFNEILENGKTRQANLIENLTTWAIETKKLKDEIDAKGCSEDTSCKL